MCYNIFGDTMNKNSNSDLDIEQIFKTKDDSHLGTSSSLSTPPLISEDEIWNTLLGTPRKKDSLEVLAENMTPVALEFAKMRKMDPKNNELYLNLAKATYLGSEQKVLFLNMTEKFLSDTKTNLFLDQFALNDKYPTYSLDNWVDYLSDRIVTKYIEKHRKVRMKSLAELQLLNPDTSNKTQSLKMLKDLETHKKDNNIVIYRIPLVENKED